MLFGIPFSVFLVPGAPKGYPQERFTPEELWGGRGLGNPMFCDTKGVFPSSEWAATSHISVIHKARAREDGKNKSTAEYG